MGDKSIIMTEKLCPSCLEYDGEIEDFVKCQHCDEIQCKRCNEACYHEHYDPLPVSKEEFDALEAKN